MISMIILSLNPVSQVEIQQVKDIFQESNCPYESLKNSFDRFSGFSKGKIFFDNAQSVYADLSAMKDFSSLVNQLNVHPQIILTVI